MALCVESIIPGYKNPAFLKPPLTHFSDAAGRDFFPRDDEKGGILVDWCL